MDYQRQRELYERIDAILTESKLDEEFLRLALNDHGIDPTTTKPKRLAAFARFSFVCLRANLARKLTGLAHREFCARLADSPLLQWFLHVGQIDQVKIFAKSTSHRFENWIGPESQRALHQRLIALCIALPEDAQEGDAGNPIRPLPFGLKEAITVEDVFFDTTCIKSPMHFPTDWVLLRDAVRTLIKGTLCIRKAGLKHRMPQSPQDFLSDMNTLCMSMSAQRRAKDSRKARKAILRKMKQLARRVQGHARSHMEVLQARRAQTHLSEGQARLIIQRLESVIEQLPAAIRQAHERIIGERQVQNADKILSLYDEHVQVIVRGKAGAEVDRLAAGAASFKRSDHAEPEERRQFGNKLSLVESRQGLILDWQLHRDNPADSKLVEPTVERLIGEMNLPIKALWADRGMFSARNEALLEERGIRSGLCPRNPRELKERLGDPVQREGMKRRGNTEARVAIFKNVMLGNPERGKSFQAREQACGWAVLSHNLWVLARMEQAQTKAKPAAEIRPSAPERGRVVA